MSGKSKLVEDALKLVMGGGDNVTRLSDVKSARERDALIKQLKSTINLVKSGYFQAGRQALINQKSLDLHKSGMLPLQQGTIVTPPSTWDMPGDWRVSGYWYDEKDPRRFGYKLQNESGQTYDAAASDPRAGLGRDNPYSFGVGFKAYAGPNAAPPKPIVSPVEKPAIAPRPPEVLDAINKEYEDLFGNEDPFKPKAHGGRTGYQTKGRVVKEVADEVVDLAKRILGSEPEVRTIKGADLLKKTEGLSDDPFKFSEFSKPLSDMEYTVKILPREEYKTIDPHELVKQNATIVGHVSDRTAAGRELTNVGGVDLSEPLVQRGGVDFQRTTPHAWANRPTAATTLYRAANEPAGLVWDKKKKEFVRIADQEGPVYMTPVFMAPQSANSSHMVGVPFIRMIPNMPISKADKLAFDATMSQKFPGWPGIENTKELEEFLYHGNLPKDAPTAFTKYAAAKKWRLGAGFPDVEEVMFSAMDPRLVGIKQGSTGMGFKELQPNKETIVKGENYHPDYPASLPSTEKGYVGGFKYQTPQGVMFPKWWSELKPELRAQDPRTMTLAQQAVMTQVPRQKATNEWADNLMKYWEENPIPWGYADGGEVYDDDDINGALRIAKAGGGGAFSVFMTDANGVDYDAQGNVIPQQERAGVIEAGEPENYESTVKPLIEAAVTPMDRPGMTEPTLLDTMKYATQAAAAGQPADARGDANWNRMRSEAVRRAMGAPESGASSPYQGPFSYNPSDMAAFANTLIDFSPVALGEVAHDVPYEAVRTGDYGSAALEGGLNALATAPGLKAAGVAGREAVNLVRQNPKIAAALAGTAVMTDPAQAEAGPARWFSKALEVAKAIPMSKMTGEQALAMLRKGTSPEELRWMGAEPFLSGQKSISKDDLVSFLEKNRVQTQDVVLGGGNKPFRREDVVLDNDIKAKYREQMGALQKDQAKAFTDITKAKTKAEIDIANDRLWSIKKQIQYINEAAIDEQIEKMGGLDRAPKYADYSTEGGEGYKENLVILGNKGMPRVVKQGNSWTLRDADNNPVMSSMNHPYFYYDKSDAERAAKAIYREGGKYKSSHWDDPDVLFHTRSQVLDVTPPGANRPYKAWNVDETQSDWGQDARKYGMRDSNTDWKKAYTELAKSSTQKWIEQKAKSAFEAAPHFYDNDIEKALKWATSEAHRIGASRIADELGIRQQLEDLYVKMTSDLDAVAAAPYVGSTEGWTDFAIKKQLDKALDADSDYFTWTPGDVHADRYNLSNFVDEIHYSPSEERLYGLKNKKGVFEKDATPDELVKLIGEGPAKKLLSQPEVESKWHSSPRRILTGVDMNIGGEGMRGYYDKVYPKRVEEVIRKATGIKPQIEVIEVQTADGPRKQLGVRLTDEMREKARFSDFNKGGRVTNGNTYDSNPAVDHAIALTREY